VLDVQRKESPQPREPVARASALHPQTAAAWARAIATKRPIPDDSDPDGFIRAHGPRALAALCGITFPIPDFVATLFDAWAAAHPEEAAFRLAWSARCDAVAAVRFRQREATGESMRDLAVLDEMSARAERDRHASELARIAAERARLVGEQQGGASPERRASAWLATVDAGSSKEAAYAALVVVRGFGLGERNGRAMLEAEYVPRFYRKVQRIELDGWVRRAMHAQKPWGWKLTEERRSR
jgi:hypothetical protein